MKKTLFLIFYFLSFSSLSTGQDLSLSYLQNNQIKPADKVFIFSYSKDMKIIKINWAIEEGYYLYLDSIFVTQQDKNIKYNIDDGTIKDHEDEFFGETKILEIS
jgi:Thiol:disulfide interchange protein